MSSGFTCSASPRATNSSAREIIWKSRQWINLIRVRRKENNRKGKMKKRRRKVCYLPHISGHCNKYSYKRSNRRNLQPELDQQLQNKDGLLHPKLRPTIHLEYRNNFSYIDFSRYRLFKKNRLFKNRAFT